MILRCVEGKYNKKINLAVQKVHLFYGLTGMDFEIEKCAMMVGNEHRQVCIVRRVDVTWWKYVPNIGREEEW